MFRQLFCLGIGLRKAASKKKLPVHRNWRLRRGGPSARLREPSPAALARSRLQGSRFALGSRLVNVLPIPSQQGLGLAAERWAEPRWNEEILEVPSQLAPIGGSAQFLEGDSHQLQLAQLVQAACEYLGIPRLLVGPEQLARTAQAASRKSVAKRPPDVGVLQNDVVLIQWVRRRVMKLDPAVFEVLDQVLAVCHERSPHDPLAMAVVLAVGTHVVCRPATLDGSKQTLSVEVLPARRQPKEFA